MKKILVMALGLAIFGTGCTAESPDSARASQSMSLPSSSSASLDDLSSVPESVSFISSSSSAMDESSSIVDSTIRPLSEEGVTLVSETEEFREYFVTATVGYMDDELDGLHLTQDLCAYYMTIPRELVLDIPIIRYEGASGKIADFGYVLQLEEGQVFSEYFKSDERFFEDRTLIEKGSYFDGEGREYYYQIIESMYNGLFYVYTFLTPLSNSQAALTVFYMNQFDRSADEPYFRSIIETITF